MNEFLTQAFGENGPRIGQFAVTTLVVLVLLLLVYWIGRRVWGNRIGGMPRGRIPRLAIVDALPIDGRRRLLLVRRDAVEHLILIGGPTDIVVEPSIMRPRQRVAQGSVGGQPMPVPPPISTAAPPGAEDASQPTASLLPRGANPKQLREGPAPAPPASRAAIAAPMIGLSEARATTTGDPGDSEFGPPPAWFTQQRDPIVAPEVPERNVPGNGATIPTAGDDDPEPLFPPLGPFARDTNGNGAHFSAFSEKHEPRIESAAADRVSELEAEMNRLLGQLSADHRSP